MKLSLVAIVLAALAGFVALTQPHQHPLGAAASPDVYQRTTFYDDAIIGAPNFATSSVGTATYTAASIINYKTITHTAASALTVTLPASSTLSSFAPHAGDTVSRFVLPVTTNITLAGGSGTKLDTASSTKVCIAGAVCELKFVRKSNSDFEVLLTSGL